MAITTAAVDSRVTSVKAVVSTVAVTLTKDKTVAVVAESIHQSQEGKMQSLYGVL